MPWAHGARMGHTGPAAWLQEGAGCAVGCGAQPCRGCCAQRTRSLGLCSTHGTLFGPSALRPRWGRHRPNQSGTPPRRGSRLCLRCCSSRSLSWMSSSPGLPSGLCSFSGNRSGNVKVCPCACGRDEQSSSELRLRTRRRSREPPRRGQAEGTLLPQAPSMDTRPACRGRCPCWEREHGRWPLALLYQRAATAPDNAPFHRHYLFTEWCLPRLEPH